MRITTTIIVMVIVLAMSGCVSDSTELLPCKVVQIVPATNWIRGTTTVEFSDGERRRRLGVWGAVGDQFNAHKKGSSGWE